MIVFTILKEDIDGCVYTKSTDQYIRELSIFRLKSLKITKPRVQPSASFYNQL